jgi:hypothetical protein
MKLSERVEKSLEEQFFNEAQARGLNVITPEILNGNKDILASMLVNTKMIVGISEDDELYVYKTKRWNAKTTLFFLGKTYLQSEHFIGSVADALIADGKEVVIKNMNTIKILWK